MKLLAGRYYLKVWLLRLESVNSVDNVLLQNVSLHFSSVNGFDINITNHKIDMISKYKRKKHLNYLHYVPILILLSEIKIRHRLRSLTTVLIESALCTPPDISYRPHDQPSPASVST